MSENPRWPSVTVVSEARRAGGAQEILLRLSLLDMMMPGKYDGRYVWRNRGDAFGDKSLRLHRRVEDQDLAEL